MGEMQVNELPELLDLNIFIEIAESYPITIPSFPKFPKGLYS